MVHNALINLSLMILLTAFVSLTIAFTFIFNNHPHARRDQVVVVSLDAPKPSVYIGPYTKVAYNVIDEDVHDDDHPLHDGGSSTHFSISHIHNDDHALHDEESPSHLSVSRPNSCLSRTQESLIRSPNQNISIPPALADAWRHYAEIHSRCAAHLLSPLHTEKAAGARGSDSGTGPSSGPKDATTSCKYLLVSDAEPVGLGNRLVALASALAFAMATDRTILIDNRRKLGDLLCEPFDRYNDHGSGSTWLIPEEDSSAGGYMSKMDAARSLGERLHRWRGPSESNSGRSGVIREVFGEEEEEEMVKIRLWDEPSEEDMEVFADDVYEALGRVKVLVWQSDLYTIPNFFMVRGFWEKWQFWTARGGGGEDGVFGYITRLALMPSNRIWRRVMREYVAYVGGAKRSVGVQVRLHGGEDRAAFRETEYRRMVACLANHSYLPPPRPPKQEQEQEQEQGGGTDERWSYDRRIERGDFRPDITVLVMSLQSQYFLRLKEDYDARFGSGGGSGGSDEAESGAEEVVRFHTVSSLQSQDFSQTQAELALAEMWLLSSAARLATSASSTFGYAAHAWANVRPLVLDFPAWRNLPPASSVPGDDPPCKLGYSPDPCSHLPRMPRAPAFLASITGPHRRWLLRHLRLCQDRPSAAWQLVRASVPTHIAPPVISS